MKSQKYRIVLLPALVSTSFLSIVTSAQSCNYENTCVHPELQLLSCCSSWGNYSI